MRARQNIALLFVVIALTSCASRPTREAVYPLAYAKSTRICSINKEYIGRVVVVEGIYQTDFHHFSVIEDQRCSSHKVIRVEAAEDHDATVDAFFRSTLSFCGPSFCMNDYQLAAEGRIVAGKAGNLALGSGQPAIQLTRVLFFRKARHW